MVPFKNLQGAQIQKTKAKATIAVVVRPLDQPRCNYFILCVELALVAITRLTDTKDLVRQSDTNAALLDCFDGHRLTL